MKEIKLMFDDDTLRRYDEYYFSKYPRRRKRPIEHPYQESINTWMIMPRPVMNALKQRWKEFMIWFIEDQGYTNLRIEKCELTYMIYYPNNRRHDPDNSAPKFENDGLVESGFIVDDDSVHIRKLILACDTDINHPRTEISVKILEGKDIDNGRE